MARRVLIAEDSAPLRRACERFLAGNDYLVTACASAAEAAVSIKTGDFPLLITDFDLGDGYGTDLIALLKEKNPFAKALLITGNEELAGTRGPGPAYADTEALIKPFDMEQLLDKLSALCGD